MKKNIILCLIFISTSLYASESDNKSQYYFAANFSPISLIGFDDNLTNAGYNYGVAEQLMDIPFKRVNFSILSAEGTHAMFGIIFQAGFNRLNNNKVALEINDGKVSSSIDILTTQLGISVHGYNDEVGKDLFVSLSMGFSSIDIIRDNFNKYNRSDDLGFFMQFGLGYSYPIGDNRNLLFGIDLLGRTVSYHKISNQDYLKLTISGGIYPYVGLMW